ncbi:arsenate reductase family protein [Paenibacillus sp. HJGM_3]|uniref:arsenate reductase family protein n=1 Tax=Paenibacillus sp. HJGM_3 TaxID=3379816 RepID=UPI00385F78FF
MPVTMYLYPKCDTCRDALKSLKRKGIEPDAINLFETPPSAETLKEIIDRSGLELKKFFNTSGEVYKELNLKDKLSGMTKDEQIALLASNGRLIKRPIVYDGQRVTVGYKEEQYGEVWGAGSPS